MPPAKPAALLSLTDRTGLSDLAQALNGAGYRLIATPGTANAVRALGLPCDDAESITGFGALLGGRVKTLHPKIFGGILAREGNPSDTTELEREGIAPISVVAVNLYRFNDAAFTPGATEARVLEEIDVGGVALLRAAAKNFESVNVLPQPDLYPEFIAALKRGGSSYAERRRWAEQAFSYVADYDATIAQFFTGRDEDLPATLDVHLPLQNRLRYGENPWSLAAFYHPNAHGLPTQLGGKTLSYNNLMDVDSCLRLIAPIEQPVGFPNDAQPADPVSAAIVKHTIPCGLASGPSAYAALEAAIGADPISAFGGIVAVNDAIDLACANLLRTRFLEVVAAPRFEADALELLRKKQNLRLLTFDTQLPAQLRSKMTFRSALGGLLVEEPDPAALPDEWNVVTTRRPDAQTWRDLLFAFGAVRQVKSNAAVVAKNQVTLGICGGQTNRVAAVELACRRAGAAVRGAVLATDGFFPFVDGLEAAISAGIAAVVAPSGSIRDAEVIEAAKRVDIILVFASRRYFLH